MSMTYSEKPPSAASCSIVDRYWILADDRPGFGDVQRIVPDGRAEMIINAGAPFECLRNGYWELQPQCFFVGQITGPMLVRPTGPAKLLGVRFRPEASSPVMRADVRELVNSIVSLDAIAPDVAHLPTIRYAAPAEEQIHEVDAALRVSAAKRDVPIAAAVDFIVASGGVLRMDDAVRLTGLSARQFERRFMAAVGIPPKLFCRIQRFQRVFQAMQGANASWVEAAIECGYYDQAHLAKDFREFAGETPAALLDTDTDLARHFLQYGEMSFLSKTRSPVAD